MKATACMSAAALALAMLVVLPTAMTDARLEAQSAIPAGFTSLFNGKDLTGWKIPDGDGGHWKVVDGVIDYDAGSQAKDDKNLWTEKSFKNFQLQIDWRHQGDALHQQEHEDRHARRTEQARRQRARDRSDRAGFRFRIAAAGLGPGAVQHLVLAGGIRRDVRLPDGSEDLRRPSRRP